MVAGIGSVLGGGGSGGAAGFFQPGADTSNQQTFGPTGFETLPGFGQEAFRQAFSRASDVAKDPSAFSDAPLTPEQGLALSTLASGLAPTSADAFATGIETFGNPFEDQVVQSAIDDINRSTAGQFSDIGQLASEAGGFGGTRQALLESELFRNQQRNIGDISGRLRAQGFESAAQRTLGDIARQSQTAQALFPLAEIERGIATSERQAPARASQFLSNLALGLPTGGGNTSTQGTFQRGAQSGADTLGQGLQIAGTAAALSSDKTLKENIEHVGEENGFNIYEFNYKSDPSERFRGVIAQEVQKVRPDAVTSVNGHLAVYYDRISLKMERV